MRLLLICIIALVVTLGIPVNVSAQSFKDAQVKKELYPSKKTSGMELIAPTISSITEQRNYQNDFISKIENCPPGKLPIDDSLLAFTKPGVNLYQCWGLKRPVLSDNIDEHQQMKYDSVICDCLKKSPIESVKKMMLTKSPKQELTVADHFAKNLKRIENELAKDRESLAFQAKNIADNSNFFKPYGKDAKTYQEVTDALSNIRKQTIDNSKKALDKINFEDNDKDKGSLQIEIVAKIASFKIPERKQDSKLFSETKLEPNQCVSGREYLGMKQLPPRNLLDQIKNAGKDYKEADWSYDKLRQAYKNHMSKNDDGKRQNKNEIIELKSKIRFLDRNPLFKTLLSLDEDIVKKIIEKNPKHIKELPKVEDVREKKKQLMVILSNFSKTQDLTKYNSSLSKFFVDNKVIKLMDKAIEFNAERKLNSISNIENFGPKQIDPKTRMGIYSKLSSEKGLKSPDTCSSNNSKNAQECVEIFAAYCEEITEVLKDPKHEAESYMFDDVDVLAENDANPDIQSNPGLQAFNEVFCKGFNDYRKDKCSKSSSYDCKSQDPEVIRKQRNEYLKSREKTLDPEFEYEVALLEKFGEKAISNESPGSSSNYVASNGRSSREDLWESMSDLRKEWDAENFTPRPVMDNFDQNVAENEYGAGDLARDFQSVADNLNSQGAVTNGQDTMSYQTGMAPAVPEQKVENMTTDQRREILDDWKKEYENLPKTSAGAPIPSAEEASLKERINSLEQLLSQQRKLTEDQYKLLNQSIAAQNKEKNDEEDPDNVKAPRRKKNSDDDYADARSDQKFEAARAPASVAEAAPQRTISSIQGSSVSGPTRKAIVTDSDSSAESIAREEAKLINLRNNADGSLTIESVKNGVNTANAITLPVSDEQYKILQTNPNGLNLNQLEQKIPKDQIAKLEKNGEIIILLRNGANPPFEVKVEKKNNKLVYRFKDDNGRPQNPVRRVNTLQALGLQFKNQ